MKYIYCVGNRWIVRKQNPKTGKPKYYGYCRTKEEAEEIVINLYHKGIVTEDAFLDHGKKLREPREDMPDYIYCYKLSSGNIRYRVQRGINGKVIYGGSYKHLEDAIARCDELNREGWKPKATNFMGVRRYIYKTQSGKYMIKKAGLYYGSYADIVEAVKKRNYLESVDWDISEVV